MLSLSWNFFVSHDKYIARPPSKEPRWYTDNTTGTGGLRTLDPLYTHTSLPPCYKILAAPLPRSRWITTPPDALPDAQPTVSKHWRQMPYLTKKKQQIIHWATFTLCGTVMQSIDSTKTTWKANFIIYDDLSRSIVSDTTINAKRVTQVVHLQVANKRWNIT